MTTFDGTKSLYDTQLLYGIFTSDSHGMWTGSVELNAHVGYVTQKPGDVLLDTAGVHSLHDPANPTTGVIKGIVYEVEEDGAGAIILHYGKHCGAHLQNLNFLTTPLVGEIAGIETAFEAKHLKLAV